MIYKYVKEPSGSIDPGILRLNDNGTVTYIPNDSANSDWGVYQAWLDDDNTPEAAE